jgi:hypothetical protein
MQILHLWKTRKRQPKPHGAVIAVYFEKSGHFPMVVERKAQIH